MPIDRMDDGWPQHSAAEGTIFVLLPAEASRERNQRALPFHVNHITGGRRIGN